MTVVGGLFCGFEDIFEKFSPQSSWIDNVARHERELSAGMGEGDMFFF